MIQKVKFNSSINRKQFQLLTLLNVPQDPKRISQKLNISLVMVYKRLNILLRKGLLKKKGMIWELTDLGNKEVKNFSGYLKRLKIYKPNWIRLHNLQFFIPCIGIDKKLVETSLIRRRFRPIWELQGNTLKADYYSYWLTFTSKGVYIRLKQDKIGKTSYQAFNEALDDIESILPGVEDIIKIPLLKDNKHIKVITNEYALIENELARHHRKEKEKMFIYDNNNDLRYIIDFSHSIDEFEAGNPQEARSDIDKAQEFFKGLVDNKISIDSLKDIPETIKGMNVFIESQMKMQENLAKNIESHIELTKQVSEVAKEMKNSLKESKKSWWKRWLK